MNSEKMRAALEAAKTTLGMITDVVPNLTATESENIVHALKQIDDVLKPEIPIAQRLLELPDQIKTQCLKIVQEIAIIEQKRAELATIEAEVDGIIASDEKLTSDVKRRAAKKLALKDRGDYAGICADLVSLERSSKQSQIELEYLHNLFSAYRSIANMGVK